MQQGLIQRTPRGRVLADGAVTAISASTAGAPDASSSTCWRRDRWTGRRDRATALSGHADGATTAIPVPGAGLLRGYRCRRHRLSRHLSEFRRTRRAPRCCGCFGFDHEPAARGSGLLFASAAATSTIVARRGSTMCWRSRLVVVDHRRRQSGRRTRRSGAATRTLARLSRHAWSACMLDGRPTRMPPALRRRSARLFVSQKRRTRAMDARANRCRPSAGRGQPMICRCGACSCRPTSSSNW